MSARKNVTLKSVAERAGTSVQTVSTVLNDSRSNTVVSAETRARILSVAEEMQYRRNPHARSLRRGYTNIIGFYSGYGTVNHANPFLSEVFGGIQKGCNEHHKDLLIHGTFRGDSVDDIYDELTNGKIDGLVIFSPAADALVRRLQSAPLPVVALADPVPGIVSVTMDDADGGRQAVDHLNDLGHRHILYIHPPGAKVSATRRLEAVRTEASRHAIRVTVAETLLYPTHAVSDRMAELVTSSAPDRPTAAICWCDGAAAVLLRYLLDNHIAVPGQFAVMGFDGFPLPFAGGARLTTFVAAWADAGRRAVSLLTDEAECDPEMGGEIHFPLQFRRGDTT